MVRRAAAGRVAGRRDPAAGGPTPEPDRQDRLVLVPDCGHWAQPERHDELLAQVRAFLAELDRGAGRG
jgi:pimeloyl-ACP methyl ester carboxylesterase